MDQAISLFSDLNWQLRRLKAFRYDDEQVVSEGELFELEFALFAGIRENLLPSSLVSEFNLCSSHDSMGSVFNRTFDCTSLLSEHCAGKEETGEHHHC